MVLSRSRTESITNCMLSVASMTRATSMPTRRSPPTRLPNSPPTTPSMEPRSVIWVVRPLRSAAVRPTWMMTGLKELLRIGMAVGLMAATRPASGGGSADHS